MKDFLTAVRDAVAGRYEVSRQIGQGGMASVFLARDTKHDRPVAVKVMLPELAAVVGGERFLREIAIIGRLNHPHVLSLYDSGEAGGLLYYVMPFIEGESLRERLERETQLSVTEAVRITRQIASALVHAHRAGIVHRDIKPENILLSAGEALVADFGIARAIDIAGGEKLTATGLSIGTPAYMAPEQWGTRSIDGRADIYALGCVLYEMLAGSTPFSGPTPAAVMARHTLDPVPALLTVRPDLPGWLQGVIFKAMAKVPAERYAGGDELIAALVARATPVEVRRSGRTVRLPASPLRLAAAAGALALVGLAAWRIAARRPVPDPSLVAVLPFQVAGTLDTGLVSPSGVANLLYTRITGEGLLRAVRPGTVEEALRRAGLSGADLSERQLADVARRVGAGRVLTGQVFGSASGLTLNATLATPRGVVLARVTDLAAPADSLLPLLDRATIALLTGSAYPGRRLDELAGTNLATARVYLGAMDAYRHGRYRAAAAGFGEALRSDSTFAPAMVGQVLVGGLLDVPLGGGAALDGALAHRGRLPTHMQMLLDVWTGDSYPAEPTRADQLAAWARLLAVRPEAWEAWNERGDMFRVWGPMLGVSGSLDSARHAYRVALEVDSTFAPALEHLIEIEASAGRTDEVRRLSARFLRADSLADNAAFVRWRSGLALGDARAVARVREGFRDLPPTVLRRILGTSQLDGLPLEDAIRAATELQERARTPVETFLAAWAARELNLNRGAVQHLTPVAGDAMLRLPFGMLFRVVEARFWDGDSGVARTVVEAAAPAIEAALTGREPPTATAGYGLCTGALDRLGRGDTTAVARMLARLRAVRDPMAASQTAFIGYCAAILDAELATRRAGGPAAQAALERLDSLVMQAYPTNAYIILAANLVSASLWESRGDTARALASLRRHPRSHESWGIAGLSSYLREEGRLSVISGDRDGAMRAWRQYLALRVAPDPPLVPAAQRVRAALDSLTGR